MYARKGIETRLDMECVSRKGGAIYQNYVAHIMWGEVLGEKGDLFWQRVRNYIGATFSIERSYLSYNKLSLLCGWGHCYVLHNTHCASHGRKWIGERNVSRIDHIC